MRRHVALTEAIYLTLYNNLQTYSTQIALVPSDDPAEDPSEVSADS